MNPKSIAVVGANNSILKMGTVMALNILKQGYQGKFFPIHSSEKMVLGHKAYPSVEELPAVPDLAMLIVPAREVASILERFGKIGTKSAIVITAGFKETGNEGKKMEKEIAETAGRYGMRFVGPNCMGIINSQIALNTTVLPMTKEPGPLGFASQSGTYVSQALPYLKKRGFRFSKAISLGNEASINIVDALEYLGEDEQTKAIILYIEGIREGEKFLEVARKITPHKPVLAQYVGGSSSGARAILSHTGAMTGPDFLYDGLFKQAGIIRVYSVEDLYSHGWTLATQPPVRGNRVGVITNSGGPSTTIAYTADAVGLQVPRFSDELQKEIRKHIEPYASSANPVDVTFELKMENLTVNLPELMMKSGEVDAVVIHGVMMTGYMREVYSHIKEMVGNVSLEELLKFSQPIVPGALELPHRYQMPLLISTFFDWEDNYMTGYRDSNTPVFHCPENTARALGSLYRYKQIKERETGGKADLPEISTLAHDLIEKAKTNGQKSLDEYAAKKLLASYDLGIAREALAVTMEEAIISAAQIGYPVAMKACSWEIMHKSGKGLIALNVESETALKTEFQNIQANAGKKVPVLIQQMLKGTREFMAGMTRFAGFGPCVIFGLGGVFTEVYNDTTLRLAPLNHADVHEMLLEIRAKKLLDEFRGMPKVRTDKLTQIIQTVGNIALLHPEITEIDLNPIIIHGEDPVIADALIVL
jgi:acetyltransferase